MTAAMSRLYGPAVVFGALLVTSPQVLAHLRGQARMDFSGQTVISTSTPGQLSQMLASADGVASRPGRQPGGVYATLVLAAGPAQEQRVVAGHTVQILAQGNGHQIIVDGRLLANDVDDDRVVIQSVHQGGGRTYILIAEQSGGNACPSLYQALDLSGPVPAISPQLGNCSDLPRVSIVGGALRVAVSAFRAAPAATYVFRDGHLSH